MRVEIIEGVFMKAHAAWAATLLTAASLLVVQKSLAETWAYAGVDRFSSLTGAYRSQGVASDGAQWFFSWRYGVQRTSNGYREVESNYSVWQRKSGIPESIEALGGNHIGDIDYHAGKIYAPIEDSPDYRNPTIAVYDAATLRHTGASYRLPQSDLTQGVPWVAVDGSKNLAYTAEWNNAVRLNVYRLSDFSPIGYIPLQRPLSRLQGAKVRGDFLYAASDNSTKSIYKISLLDGSVTEPLQLAQWHDMRDDQEHELEGLSFRTTPTGETLNVLMVHGSPYDLFGAYTMFFHFTLGSP
ncbi:MAG: hypothetical protein V7642_3317 [Burkholderiales bacterium]